MELEIGNIVSHKSDNSKGTGVVSGLNLTKEDSYVVIWSNGSQVSENPDDLQLEYKNLGQCLFFIRNDMG